MDILLLHPRTIAALICCTAPESVLLTRFGQPLLGTSPTYIVAPQTIKTEPTQAELAKQKFLRLSEKWHAETGGYSVLHKKLLHPAYQQIIGMGQIALPFILEELETRPGHWLHALESIAAVNPVPPGSDLRQAIDRWLEWGGRQTFTIRSENQTSS